MFPIQSTLFLIPTSKEREIFLDNWKLRFQLPFPAVIHICGFGPISSGISTSQLLRPVHERVCLLGIAGTFDTEAFPVGEALFFDHVTTDCVGAESQSENTGQPSGTLRPSELGFCQWESTESSEVFQDLPLYHPQSGPQSTSQLLTVGVASGTEGTTVHRKNRFAAIAEDMEGFSVALAARVANLDCSIVRGASNQVGDRHHKNWQIDLALRSVADLLQPLICF